MNNLDIELPIKYEESDNDDCDIYEKSEIDVLFRNSESVAEKLIGDENYILHITATPEFCPRVAVGVSDFTCDVYNLSNNAFASISRFANQKEAMIDCKFSTENYNLLYTASYSSVHLYDTRQPQQVAKCFEDTTENNTEPKIFSSFDISCDNRILSVGTDLYKGDAYILFWDLRNTKLLGGYWDSHTDDVTQVKFHPTDRNKLISGSTDGIINVYDIKEPKEDDALVDSLNTESSIEQLQWYNIDTTDAISCITHTADLQLWKIDGAEPYKHLSRASIAAEIKRSSADHVYVVKTHSTRNSLLLLAGSNTQDGQCLRGVQIFNKDVNVKPALGFTKNSQRVRASWYNMNTNILMTGGEKGYLNVWKAEL